MSFHEALPQPWTYALLAALGGVAAGIVARAVIRRVALPLARRTPTDVDEVVLAAAATPTLLTLSLLGFAAAARLLDPSREALVSRALLTSLVLVWGWTLAHLASQLLAHSGRKVEGRSHARGVVILGRFAKAVAAVILFFTVLALWGVSITPLLASAGIAGIALAFAAQDTLANLFAGVAIFLDRIFEVGDVIVLEEGQQGELRGVVRDIGLRSTRLLTRSDVIIVVPNSVIASARVVNESASRGRYRVSVRTRVGFDSDLEHVERVLLEIGRGQPGVLRDPEPRVRVRAFEDSGIRVDLLVWIVDPFERGPVVHQISKAIHRRFGEEGIVIPLPQRVLRQQPAP